MRPSRWGVPLQGQALRSFGVVSALSFNGNKIVTTGGGGAILTNDEELARRARHLTTTAKKPHAWEFDHDEVACELPDAQPQCRRRPGNSLNSCRSF